IRDLVLTPEEPEPGENVMARFTITATDAPIESIYYTIYLDGSIIGGDRAYSIEAGGSELISYSFEATEGRHSFMVRLDVDQDLEESDVTNNEITQSFTVKKSGASNLPIYLAAVAIIIVGSAVLYRYSTRKPQSSAEIVAKPVITESSVSFPLVLNCIQCGSRVRVARPGAFRCPSCKSVANVNSNGEIGSGEEPSNKPSGRKPSSTQRRLRMEGFFSGEPEQELEEEPEEVSSELSASEKLELFKQKEGVQVSETVTEPEPEPESEPEAEPEKEEKKTRKRKGPPKGGSFGPTVGGF
ncbi:MAG: CARDB domain-containing protein, partial [Candidatus Thermoplasmatota archaeon]|nr:CARDB domain-containing protein [Candidatus Thermoplasmatota archaeon]